MAESDAPALKEIFNAERFRHVAREVAAIEPRFKAAHFLELSMDGLESLSLLQRLRRMTQSLHATLPPDFLETLGILRKLAPRINRGFVTLVLPDYVGLYGHDHFDASMDALKFFTPFGSSEFAVREFLRRDLSRSLSVMETWSRDADEHVRRLACEGCRPRLPWSFRLGALVADPGPAACILENLRADPSLYVRKSVANHLNDITKDHPDWVMARLESWPLEVAHTTWIAKRALRTLIKRGDPRALSLIGAGAPPEVRVHDFGARPPVIALGGQVNLSFGLESRSLKAQRLVIDYTVHYVKKSGGTSAKVFKLKELTLGPGERILITRNQTIRNFTTRVHYPGRHAVELLLNGQTLAQTSFELQ